MKIWIIDDDASTRLLIRALILESDAEPSEILEMASAEEALAALNHGKSADVYLVDLNMPGMSGQEFCRTLRASEFNQSEYLPYIIVITYTQAEETPGEVLDAGANDYLSKPVNRKVLHTRLRVAGKLIDQARDYAGYKYAQSVISLGFAHAAVPAAILDVQEPPPNTYIVYANIAMLNLIQTGADAALGHSLAKFQSWQKDMMEACSVSFASAKPFSCKLLSDSPYFTSLDLRVSGYPICLPGADVTQYLILEEPFVMG